jgi:hypothetical protein
MSGFDAIPNDIKDKLIRKGYDSVQALPNNPESSKRWKQVRSDCNLSNGEINKIINALFPYPGPPQQQG